MSDQKHAGMGDLVPLGVIALELDTTVAGVAGMLGPDAIVRSRAGLRCATEEAVAHLINARDVEASISAAKRRRPRGAADPVIQLRAELDARPEVHNDNHISRFERTEQ